MLEFLNKYKWYILCYVFYVSIVFILIENNYRGRDHVSMIIGWCISAPVLAYIILFIIITGRKIAINEGINISQVIRKNIYSSFVAMTKPTETIFKPGAFIKHWTLIDFAKKFGPRLQVGEFRNSVTWDFYNACIFTDRDGKMTYVEFSVEVGDLRKEEIEKRKNELFIGELISGKYIIYDKHWKDWEDVDLGI